MIYMLLANGFEEAEAVVPCDILRRGEVDVKLVGVNGLSVTSAHGITMIADITLDQVDVSQAEMVILPGGLLGVENILASEAAMALLEACHKEGRRLSAICAAPTVFGKMGILEGKAAVCYPGMEDGLGGAIHKKGDQVAVAGSIITGEGPGSTYEFGYALLEALKGKTVMENVKHAMHFRY